jgi:aspartyl-tRNA(Asn)/glutamyl-tRNA(Gln) amidotransferase subunit C
LYARGLAADHTLRLSRKQPVSLDKDQVQHIAMLARLKLDDDEFAETVDKLSRIVDFVDQLSQAATDDVVPMAHPYDEAQRLRPDCVTEANDRDHIQQNTESAAGGLYLVPKVLD